MDDVIDYSKKVKQPAVRSRTTSQRSSRIRVPTYQQGDEEVAEADAVSYRSKRSSRSKSRSRSTTVPNGAEHGAEAKEGAPLEEEETTVRRPKSSRSLRSVKREPLEDKPIMHSVMPNQTPIIDYSVRRVSSNGTAARKHTRATSVALPVDDGPDSDFDEFADDDDELPESATAPTYLGDDLSANESEPVNNSTTFKFLGAPDEFLSSTTPAPHDMTFISLPPIRPVSHFSLSPNSALLSRAPAPTSIMSVSEYDDEEEVLDSKTRSNRDSVVNSVQGYSNGLTNGRKASVPKSVMSIKSVKSVNGRSVAPVGDLTAQDRHYLNKIFASLQIQREFSALSRIGTLTNYGKPFLSHPNGPNSRPSHLQRSGGGFLGFGGGGTVRAKGWENYDWQGSESTSPITTYLNWRFVYNFPALRLAKPEYWTTQIQPFFDSFAEHDLSTTKERSEVTKRRLLAMGFARILGTYYGTCMKALGPSQPARPNAVIMRRIDNLYPGSMGSMWRSLFPGEPQNYNAWSAIAGTGSSKKGDDAFYIITKVLVTAAEPTYLALRTWSNFQKFALALSSLDPRNTLLLPLLPPSLVLDTPPTRAVLQRYLRTLIIALSSPPTSTIGSTKLSNSRKELEKFLLEKTERASEDEKDDWIGKAEVEDEELERQRKAWEKVGKRSKTLRTTWAMWRGALINGNEIDKSMAIVRRHPSYTEAPQSYQDAECWASMWVAYALHYVFVVSSNGPEVTQLFKSFHDLVPYGALKLGLSLVNPTLAIRTFMAIILGQPAGQPSLFQRIFSLVLGIGIRAAQRIIDSLRKKLAHDSLADAVSAHVYGTFEQRAATRTASQRDEEEILITIVRDHGNSADVKLVESWQAAFVKRSLSIRGVAAHAEDESSAGRYQLLKNLLRALCRKRDREQVLEVVMEHNTPVMMKASISVFYDSIYKIANASNLSARLGDLQAFFDDLIKVAMSDNREPSDFIQLTARHDKKMWFFIHELSSNGGGTLMDPLIKWCKSGLNFIKSGIPSATSRRPTRSGVDYDALLSRTSPATRTAILSEVRGLALWTSYKKCWSDISLRVDLLAIETGVQADKEALYSDLLSQDQEVLDFLEARGEEEGERPEDSVGWAWFGDEDVLDDPSAIKLDWKAAENAEAALIAARKAAKAGGGARLFKRSSTKNTVVSVAVKEEVKMLRIPAPRVRATKTLLDDYVEAITRSLVDAKEDEILMYDE